MLDIEMERRAQAEKEMGVTGQWRVAFFNTKKAAEDFALNHAIRNTPICKVGRIGWRLCWLPPQRER